MLTLWKIKKVLLKVHCIMSIVEVQFMELKIYIIALTFPQLLCNVVFITIFFFATLHCSEAPHVPLLRNQYFIRFSGKKQLFSLGQVLKCILDHALQIL